MEKLLLNKIKNMSGTTLGIGINKEAIRNAIEKNKNIETCYLLEEPIQGVSKFGRKKLYFNKKLKKVNIKKIRKIFKKKRIENLICNYKTISPFLKTFVKDSVYINKGKLYIYGQKTELDSLIKKYRRYTDKIEIEENKDDFLIIIDNKNSKNNKLKEFCYWWSDTFESLLDLLTTLLVN